VAHPKLTVVVVSIGRDAGRLVAQLLPTLGLLDTLVLVLLEHEAAPAGGSRVQYVRVPAGTGFRQARDAGAAAAPTDYVVFLDADTVVAPSWLDPLVGPLANPDVSVVGPACTLVSGLQCVPAESYDPADAVAVRRFARDWRRQSGDERRAVAELSELCLAVRRATLLAAGGWSSTDPLAALARFGSFVYAPGSFVHHAGDDRCGLRQLAAAAYDDAGPLLSACLIVRDEEAVLARALASLRGLADEVVVYDTGSTDRTREVARAAGAVVVEGYWDEDFAGARNRALAHCAGRWVLSVDADEVVEGDVAAARRELEGTTADRLLLRCRNLVVAGSRSANVLPVARLFRRHLGRWAGRLHEQILHRTLGNLLPEAHLEAISLLHDGYLAEIFAGRGKKDRNLLLARRAVEAFEVDGALDGVIPLVHLVGCLAGVGEHEEALERAEEAWAGSRRVYPRYTVSRHALRAALALGDAQRVLHWADRLESVDELPWEARAFRARAQAFAGDHEAVLATLASLPATARHPTLGWDFRRSAHARVELASLSELGRHEEALPVLLQILADGEDVPSLSAVVRVHQLAGASLEALAAAVPPRLWRSFTAQAAAARAEEGDRVLEALWSHRPGDLAVLAAALHLAPVLPLARALEWSARVRSSGAADCPLLALAGATTRSAKDRVLAAAVAWSTFGDMAAFALFERALVLVTDDEQDAVLAQLAAVAPDLAALVEAA